MMMKFICMRIKQIFFKFKGLNLIIVNLGRCDIIYDTIGDPYASACVPNKVEIINVKLFNMITDINKAKTLIKHISCDSRCKLDGRKCNSEEKLNHDKFLCECKEPLKYQVCKENYP